MRHTLSWDRREKKLNLIFLNLIQLYKINIKNYVIILFVKSVVLYGDKSN